MRLALGVGSLTMEQSAWAEGARCHRPLDCLCVLLCLVNTVVWGRAVSTVSAATGDHICCLRRRIFPSALVSVGLVFFFFFCVSPGSYSLPDNSALCPLDTIIASPCFVLQCAETALKELLTPYSPSFDCSTSLLCALPPLVLYISLFLWFSSFHFSAPDPTALSDFSYMLSVFSPPKSPLSAPAMKWQLRGCQCGFSSLLILFQRDLEIQH